MAINITSGFKYRPQRVVIYGPEGIGKTTLASKFDDPVFIDTENGSGHLDVKRIDLPKNWVTLLETVKEVSMTGGLCKTLVLDTADWAESLCIESVCKKYNQPSIEAFGYGKGYVYVMEEWQRLLKALDAVIDSGVTVVITAHAKMRKFEQPDALGAYDRWEMKLSRQVAPLLKEWCDCLLFLNYKTTVITDASGKAKAQGGKRWIYATHNPCWDAKNRLGLPDDMELTDDLTDVLFKSIQKTTDAKPFPLWDLMQRDKITQDEIEAMCYAKHFCEEGTKLPDFSDELKKFLVDGWENVIKLVTADRNLPF